MRHSRENFFSKATFDVDWRMRLTEKNLLHVMADLQLACSETILRLFYLKSRYIFFFQIPPKILVEIYRARH